MAKIHDGAAALYALEQLSEGSTVVHGLHPTAKLLATAVYLLAVISFPRYTISGMIPLVLYPVLMLTLGELPFSLVAKRTMIALPFCLFAGLSNVLLDRSPAVYLGSVGISGGVLSCGSILLKTLLCVSAVLVLVGVTPLRKLTAALRRLHVPGVFVSLFEMTYRYVGTLLEEGGAMVTAYALRGQPRPDIRHMGSFFGMLLLRSYDRAERIYHAMKCRGYGGAIPGDSGENMKTADLCFLLTVGLYALLCRFINITAMLGGVLC